MALGVDPGDWLDLIEDVGGDAADAAGGELAKNSKSMEAVGGRRRRRSSTRQT